MANIQRHIAGKLVKAALADPRRNRRGSGPWAVHSDHKAGSEFTQALHHHGTKMLEWTYIESSGVVNITGTWTGWGSVSDQTGVNSALYALGSSLHYHRDQKGGGPRINPRRRRNPYRVGRAAVLRVATPPVY